MPPSSFKDRVKQQREQEILRAAGHIICEQGYSHLNMDTLAEMVGVSKPTLYQHFASKDELFTRVMVDSMEALEAHVLEHTTGTPLQRLETLLRSLIKRSYEPDSLIANLRSEHILEILGSEAVAAHKARMLALLSQIIDTGKTQGQIKSEVPTIMVVHLLFYLLGGVRQCLGPPLNYSLDAATEVVVTLFKGAITA
ncbi:MAG TPA: TetR/AcrR family transcriptional regulator [Phototrophicaceae bacterium]|nr:TetR/AcrR family transcriptional regulator [Phototrophicaceae bacterium]